MLVFRIVISNPIRRTIEYNWWHIDEVCAIEVPNAKYTNSYKQGTVEWEVSSFQYAFQEIPERITRQGTCGS